MLILMQSVTRNGRIQSFPIVSSSIARPIYEGSFTSRNVIDASWKFRNLKQKFRNLNQKFRNMHQKSSEMYGYLREFIAT